MHVSNPGALMRGVSPDSLPARQWRHLHSITRVSVDSCSSQGTSSRCQRRHQVRKLFKSILLTLWRPPLPYGYSYKASCARPG